MLCDGIKTNLIVVLSVKMRVVFKTVNECDFDTEP